MDNTEIIGERLPGADSGERELGPNEEDFEKAMEGVDKELGNRWNEFGELVVDNKEGMEQGEVSGSEISGTAFTVYKSNEAMDENKYNAAISDAAAIINYGLNAAARDRGVESVVQAIKSFDVTGSSDVIRDLYLHLGIDTLAEVKELNEEARATSVSEGAFRAEQGVQNRGYYSNEGAIAAINSMKELIDEVEGADSAYEELRLGARAAGKGYFEYAVEKYDVRDLTVLFKELARQKEKTKWKVVGGMEKKGEVSVKGDEVTEGPSSHEMTGGKSDEFAGVNPEILKEAA